MNNSPAYDSGNGVPPSEARPRDVWRNHRWILLIASGVVLALFLLLAGFLKERGRDRAIFRAIDSGNTVKANELLEKDPGLVAAKDGWGKFPLHHAAMKNNVEIVQLLVAKGADVNCEEDYTVATSVPGFHQVKTDSGNTPLYDAILNDSKEAADFLLQHGANPNARNAREPLIHTACRSTHRMLELLLGYGANANLPDKFGERPIQLLRPPCIHKYELLLSHGADPNVRDKIGRSPLDYAKGMEDKATVALLLAYGEKSWPRMSLDSVIPMLGMQGSAQGFRNCPWNIQSDKKPAGPLYAGSRATVSAGASVYEQSALRPQHGKAAPPHPPRILFPSKPPKPVFMGF